MKKVNLFYLKDILLKPFAHIQEKMECLYQIKRNVQKQPVFAMAMKSLIAEFHKINEPLIQKEVLNVISISNHQTILAPLKEMLKVHCDKLSDDIIEEVEETILTLN